MPTQKERKEKKKVIRSFSSHPAAISAESDLVKLTREFESLKQQLKDNDDAIEEHRSQQRGEEIAYEASMKYHNDAVAHLQRQRRTLEAQFTNCTELMTPLIQTGECHVNTHRISATECRTWAKH